MPTMQGLEESTGDGRECLGADIETHDGTLFYLATSLLLSSFLPASLSLSPSCFLFSLPYFSLTDAYYRRLLYREFQSRIQRPYILFVLHDIRKQRKFSKKESSNARNLNNVFKRPANDANNCSIDTDKY